MCLENRQFCLKSIPEGIFDHNLVFMPHPEAYTSFFCPKKEQIWYF
jgi:hypothetical protein